MKEIFFLFLFFLFLFSCGKKSEPIYKSDYQIKNIVKI